MMKYFVTLNERSRFPKPPMGGFIWSGKLNNFAWKGKSASTVEELAALVNDAAIGLNRIANDIYILGVTAVEEDEEAIPAAVIESPASQPETVVPEPEAPQEQPTISKLPKKLQPIRRTAPISE